MLLPLFSSYKKNKLLFRNRIIASPKISGLALESGNVTDEMLQFYKQIASSGAAGVIVEDASISNYSRIHPKQLTITDVIQGPQLMRLSDVIKKEGAVPFIRLTHYGLQSLIDKHHKVFGPSFLSKSKQIVEELTFSGIKEIIASFTDAAKIAFNSGFTGIEIQGGDGDLIHQFISPLTNKRFDEYGLDSPFRYLFPLEIIKAIKAAVPEILISWRLSLKDYLPGGVNLHKSLDLAKQLSQLDVNLFHVSGGIKQNREGYGSLLSKQYPEAVFKNDAAILKQNVSIPVILSGNIHSAILANKALASECCDLVSVSRAIMRDQEWTRKATRDVVAESCLRCIYCSINTGQCPDGKIFSFSNTKETKT